jgi:hypothetical protein
MTTICKYCNATNAFKHDEFDFTFCNRLCRDAYNLKHGFDKVNNLCRLCDGDFKLNLGMAKHGFCKRCWNKYNRRHDYIKCHDCKKMKYEEYSGYCIDCYDG